MLRILKLTALGLLLFAASSCKRNGYTQLRDGLYVLTDSASGAKVACFKKFDYATGSEFVDTTCILSLKNVTMSMQYDSMMYADTFARISANLTGADEVAWKQKTGTMQRQKLALILNSQFIQWMVIPDSAVAKPAFMFCYCDYSKAELKKIEGLIKERDVRP